jgi:hypothetical protein
VLTVAPSPIIFLLIGRQFAEVSMLVVMMIVGPLVVVADLLVVPNVVVTIVGVVDPMVMVCATHAQGGTCQCGGEETGTENAGLAVHL